MRAGLRPAPCTPSVRSGHHETIHHEISGEARRRTEGESSGLHGAQLPGVPRHQRKDSDRRPDRATHLRRRPPALLHQRRSGLALLSATVFITSVFAPKRFSLLASRPFRVAASARLHHATTVVEIAPGVFDPLSNANCAEDAPEPRLPSWQLTYRAIERGSDGIACSRGWERSP